MKRNDQMVYVLVEIGSCCQTSWPNGWQTSIWTIRWLCEV